MPSARARWALGRSGSSPTITFEPLAAVAQDGDGLPLKGVGIGVVGVENSSHQCAPLTVVVSFEPRKESCSCLARCVACRPTGRSVSEDATCGRNRCQAGSWSPGDEVEGGLLARVGIPSGNCLPCHPMARETVLDSRQEILRTAAR